MIAKRHFVAKKRVRASLLEKVIVWSVKQQAK